MKKQTNVSKKGLVYLAFTAMLVAMSFALFLLEFPVSLGSSPLRMDFSDIPALFGAIFYGPLTGVIIELLKNLLELAVKGMGTQMGFGNIMNFIVGCAYIVPFSIIIRSKMLEDKKSVKFIVGCVVGVISIVCFGLCGNYFIAPPFFKGFLNIELTSEALWGFIGSASILNVIKGVMLSVVAIPIVKVLIERIKKITKQL